MLPDNVGIESQRDRNELYQQMYGIFGRGFDIVGVAGRGGQNIKRAVNAAGGIVIPGTLYVVVHGVIGAVDIQRREAAYRHGLVPVLRHSGIDHRRPVFQIAVEQQLVQGLTVF